MTERGNGVRSCITTFRRGLAAQVCVTGVRLCDPRPEPLLITCSS